MKRQALVKLEFVIEVDDTSEALPSFRARKDVLAEVASKLSLAPISLVPGGRISVCFLNRLSSLEGQSCLSEPEESSQEDRVCRARRVTDMLARFETTPVARVHRSLFEDVGVIRYHALASADSIDIALDRLEAFLGGREEA